MESITNNEIVKPVDSLQHLEQETVGERSNSYMFYQTQGDLATMISCLL